MGFIPEDKLLEIKDAASIEEVVGQYVKLTQKGKNLLGLCPFHSETKPSFTVAPEKGIFYCFGCGAGGNVISFLMQYQRLSFPEAAQELARRYGIPLSVKDLGPEGAQQAKKRTKAYEINAAAAAFYDATLASSAGKPGRDYLAKRGLTPEIIKAFHLGYAVEEWDSLRRHLQGRGISLELAQEVGLLAPRDRRRLLRPLPEPHHLPHLRPAEPGHRLRRPHHRRGRTQVPQLSGKPALLQGPHPLRPAPGRRGPAPCRRGPGGGGLSRPHLPAEPRHRQRPGHPRHRPHPGAGAPAQEPGRQSGPGL